MAVLAAPNWKAWAGGVFTYLVIILSIFYSDRPGEKHIWDVYAPPAVRGGAELEGEVNEGVTSNPIHDTSPDED